MIELALLMGLGAVGYMLATQEPRQEGFELQPRATADHTDMVVHKQTKGHSNQVPFFGARVTQSMYSGATDQLLDNHTGAGKEYFQKRETKSFYDIKTGTGNPFGQQVESDFIQSRMDAGTQMRNTFPIDQTQVAPGINAGYTNLGSGGFQQDAGREYALPPTTDELRVATKPKVTFSTQPVPGAAAVTRPGIQAPVNKNRPDKFAVLGMERVNTAVGQQVANAMYPEVPMKDQARDSTTVQYYGSGNGAGGVWSTYLRAFTEPFQEFMKLTADGRPGPAGPLGSGNSIGAHQISVHTRKDESILSDATRFNVPTSIVTSGSEHLGSYRYKEPLQQDVHLERSSSYAVEAHQRNPYSQRLDAI
jgi:hypothetical protein